MRGTRGGSISARCGARTWCWVPSRGDGRPGPLAAVAGDAGSSARRLCAGSARRRPSMGSSSKPAVRRCSQLSTNSGDRSPDIEGLLLDGNPTSLFDLISRPEFTVLVLEGEGEAISLELATYTGSFSVFAVGAGSAPEALRIRTVCSGAVTGCDPGWSVRSARTDTSHTSGATRVWPAGSPATCSRTTRRLQRIGSPLSCPADPPPPHLPSKIWMLVPPRLKQWADVNGPPPRRMML